VRAACSQAEETLKWGAPFFLYQGRIICGMAAFKAHCAFFFWHKSMRKKSASGMGQLGKITALSDLPSDKVLTAMIRRAMRLNEKPKAAAAKKPKAKQQLKIPGYFTASLCKNKKAMETFKRFSHSQRKEYVEWVAEAKAEATRDKRLTTAIKWLAEGKVRNWKYIKHKSGAGIKKR
jgi:uncharacterized protein YdeI (YjbR/CyaY-like superfamily)